MSTLALPDLKRRLLARHRAERWRRRRHQILFGMSLLLVGGFVGFQAQTILRIAVEGPLSQVSVSAAERRALELIRPIGFAWTSVLSAEQVALRLRASAEATALVRMLDSLPSPAEPSQGGWLSQPSTGRMGRSAAISVIARSIAEQSPSRQAPLASLLADLAASNVEARVLVEWVSALPQQERSRLRAVDSGPLMTTAGRSALLALAALPMDQIQQCQESARIMPQDWSRLRSWLNASGSQLASFRQIAELPEQQIARLTAIAWAYSGPGQNSPDAPYPCLDRPGKNWVRHGRPFLTCTVALH